MERYALIHDVGASGLPQCLIVKETTEEIVEAALQEWDREVKDSLADDVEFSFWVCTTPTGSFDKLGYVETREDIVHFFD